MAEWGGRRGTNQVIIVFVFLALTFVILSLRLLTRIMVTRNHGLEDWVITAAFCFSVAQAALVLNEVQHGQGLPQSELSDSDLLHLTKTLWVAIPIYLLGLGLTKLSILLQYMRLFSGRAVQNFIIVMLIFVAAYGVWSVLGSFFICTPVHYFWDQIGDGHCMDFEAKWFSDTSINIVTDLIILGIPMPFLESLNLPRRQKAGLIAVFALGGFVCLVSMARLRPLYVIATSHDVSKDNGPVAWLSSLEVNVGIICSSLPSLRAITIRTISRKKNSSLSQHEGHNSNKGWWQFDKQDDNLELEDGHGQNSSEPSAITKSVTIETGTHERRDSSRWSSAGHGSIFDGISEGGAKAWVKSGK